MRQTACIGLVIAFAALARGEDAQWQPLITSQGQSGELQGWGFFSEDAAADVDDVWKLNDDGVLVCSGTPRGYIYTKRDYGDFVLRLQWRWPPEKAGRGGVLLRMTGEHRIWPTSLEAQINAGDAGDFWGLAGYPIGGPAQRKNVIQHDQFGTLTNIKKTAPAEKETGDWNEYEITVRGDTVTLVINGQEVNRATGCSTTPGKICLTAEGDEIHFRKVEVKLLK